MKQGPFDALRRFRLGRRWTFVLRLFFVVKLTVLISGYVALAGFGAARSAEHDNAQTLAIEADQPTISHLRGVSMWYVWDSFIYWRLSTEDYLAPATVESARPTGFWASTPLDPAHVSNYSRFSFYPGYPLLSWLVGKALGGRHEIAPLVVANVGLLFALYFGHRLGENVFSSERAARRLAKFLLLSPGAIVLHGALCESLFLMFVLAAFFFAETRRWLVAGLFGAGAALTRSIGVLLCLPLAVLAIEQATADRADGRSWLGSLARSMLSLSPIPLVFAGFLLYCRRMTGDWLAYNTLQSRVFHMQSRNPFAVFAAALQEGIWSWNLLRASLVIGCLAIVLLAARKLRPAYLAYALLFALIPAAAGGPGTELNGSVIRYLAVVFPIALAVTHFTTRRATESYVTLALALFQGVILATWINYWTMFVV
jgi:hypothetical protein